MDLTDNPTYYISNRLRWQAKGITCIRRHRWPVEVYHQEGKAEGLDQYQMRSFSAIERHIALVAVTYAVVIFSILVQGLTIGPLIRSIK